MLSAGAAEAVESPRDHCGHVERRLLELSRRETDDFITSLAMDDVPPVVALDGGATRVERMPVHLDDQAHVRPAEVSVEPCHAIVGLRCREAGRADQPQHRPLATGARAGRPPGCPRIDFTCATPARWGARSSASLIS